MLDFLKNLPEEVKHFFWLMVVSFVEIMGAFCKYDIQHVYSIYNI